MMFYAIENAVSTAPISGSIRITESQYQEAIEGMMEGLKVKIKGGRMVLVRDSEHTEEEDNE